MKNLDSGREDNQGNTTPQGPTPSVPSQPVTHPESNLATINKRPIVRQPILTFVQTT